MVWSLVATVGMTSEAGAAWAWVMGLAAWAAVAAGVAAAAAGAAAAAAAPVWYVSLVSRCIEGSVVEETTEL